jgi:hypothetical protein
MRPSSQSTRWWCTARTSSASRATRSTVAWSAAADIELTASGGWLAYQLSLHRRTASSLRRRLIWYLQSDQYRWIGATRAVLNRHRAHSRVASLSHSRDAVGRGGMGAPLAACYRLPRGTRPWSRMLTAIDERPDPRHRTRPQGGPSSSADSRLASRWTKDRDPRACWALIDTASRSVEFRVSYRVEAAARAVEASELPSEFADQLREAGGYRAPARA